MNRSEHTANQALHATLKAAEAQRNAQPFYIVTEGLELAPEHQPRRSFDPRNNTGRRA